MPLNDFRSVCLPYCLQQQADGTYVVLNREYKPLGFRTKEFVQYAQYPVGLPLKGLTAAKAKKISARGEENLNYIYLYNDGCIPTDSKSAWEAYSQRLKLLADLEMTDKL